MDNESRRSSYAISLALALIGCALVNLPIALGRADNHRVDLELIIAVDVSFSISEGEQDIQRRGYANAFSSGELVQAVTSGPHGRIAVIYFEWAGPDAQYRIVPWTVIDGPGSANDFAARLRKAPIRRGGETSIAQALLTASSFFPFSASPYTRRVIDISGDGPNNSGGRVEEARRSVLAKGITINGLPLIKGAGAPGADVDMARYYKDCVIGGPGAFSLPVSSWQEFERTLTRKLVTEVAGARAGPGRVILAAAEEKADCLAGEKSERENYLKQLDDLTNGKSQRWRPREQDWPTPK